MNMPKQTGRRGVLGFSMAEMLIVVAIMAVLGGVGTVAGRQVLRSTRQTALDRMAEQIYMAASQNIRTLEAAGLQGQVIALSEELKKQYVNSGMDLPALSNHDASTEELRDLILPAKSMSSELENGLWALEFVPGSNGQVSYYEEDQGKYCPMRVNSVFFIRAEDKNSYLYLNIGDRSDYFTLWTLLSTEDIRENLKVREYRMNETDARIGFYDGSSGGEVKVDGENQNENKKDAHGLSLSVSNGEELTVTCTCDSTDPNVTFVLKLTAPDGTTAYLRSGSEDNPAWSITYEDSKPVCTFTLDSLKSPDTQFKNLPFQDADGNPVHLTPGENYTLSLVVEQGGKSTEAASHPVVNSLFDARTEGTDDNPDTVFISCGRHLQNLDPAVSGVRRTVSAVQTTDISFEKGSPWAEAYHDDDGNPSTFLPIYGDSGISGTADSYHLSEFHALPEKVITGLTVGAPGSRTGAARDTDTTPDGEKKDTRDSAGLFGTFSGSTISGINLLDASITGGPEGGYQSAGTLIGDIRDAQGPVTLKNITVTAPLSGDRPLISGDAKATSAGGLIGTVSSTDSPVKLVGCGVYLKDDPGETSTDHHTADQPDIHGSSFAGGLVGQSAGDLNIINSYAALVVSSASQTDGSGTTGGLIGASDGNLTVNSSYADCYLSGGTIGGIAGSLGKDTETTFEKTYSAGFAVYPLLDGQKPEDVTSAGGQFFGSRADGASVTFAVPEDGDNREKCCSLFNFTDVTASPDESGGRPKLSDVTEQRDGDGITGGENLLITEEELASIRQDPGGMTEKEKADAAEHPYNLSGADLGMGDTFPYPGFGLPRHGDWMPDADMGLVPVSGTVSKAVRILYLLFDEKGNALVKDAPAFDTDGTLDGRRFKGTARMNVTLPPQKATAMEMEAYRAAYGTVMLGVPENITGCAFAGWYTFDAALDDDTPMVDLTQLLSADEVLKDGTLTYQFEEAYVQSVRDGTAAAPTLYAVYKDARPLTVTLEFYYLDKTMAAKDQAVKAQKGEALSFRDLYMGGCGVKILQSVKYEIPHGEIGKERTVTLPEIEGYMFLDSSTGELGANYRGPCARLSGADGVSAEDALKRNDSENAWTLTISTDQPYTYALLYEYAVKTFDIQYAFHQSRPDEAVIGGELNRAAVEAAMNGGPAYTAEESSTFRVVKQGLEESADSSTTMYQYAFPGFELYKTENQNLGTSHQTIFHYRRNAYALSYDLRGGYDTESGSRTSYRATRSVYYGEPLDGYLPGESVKKNGYALECWSLDWRGKTGSVTWDPIQALEEGETERERIPAPVMPAADVEASAVWEFSVENVRIEVYYQSVTDPLDAGSDGAPERTYKLYSVNSLSARDLLSTAANGVPAYYGQKTNADGTAVDSQGKPIDDCGRTSLAFATMKSLWDTIAETEKKDGQTEAARKVERYLLPAVMGGKLKLDDYHLRGWKSPDYLPPRQVYEQVITTPVQYRKWDGVEQANKDYFSDTPADSETITETVKEVGGIQVTTRTIARTVVSFRNEERGEGYYLKWTGKAVTGPMTLVESYDAEGSSGKCYSEVLRYDSAYTGRHLPYVDSAGELVFRLYYNRSLYQILFYYDANISSRDCVSWINSFANNTDYYERLSAYGDIKAYIDGTRADSPVCEYERCQFTVKKQNQTMYYYHNSTYTGESGVTSTRQFILESLYGAPLDHEHIWNGKSSNDFVWGQVNSGTYTAQLPLTIFNASDPEGINRVEYAYFGQDRDKGFVKAYVEDDDRGYGQPSSGLREEDFGPEGGLLTHLIAANIYPPAILSEDKSKEYAYVDGYEYWGYKRIPYNNDPASTEGAELKGWRGTSAIETDLQPLGINIANITTNAYWPDIYKNQPDPAAGTFSKLILYFQRKTYHIEYTNVEYGGTKHEEGDTYLYREPVERLPGLPALTAANCPYGNNYAFKGWYTSSSFAEETRVTDENGEFTNAFRANSGLFEADENGVYASAFRMPSYNLVLVARWEKAANTVTFHPCFPASGSSPAWTMTNLAADGTVPDEEFYLVADEQDRASHQALMGLLAERYGGDGMEYRDEAWYYVSGDAEWKFDGWYYYHGAGGTVPNRADLTQQYNLTAPVVSDDHLYARWTQTKGRLTITVVCRDRDTKQPITGTGGAPYTQTIADLNINMATPEVITLFARTDIPGYFPVLASRDITVTAENETVCMDYEKGVNWSYTIQPSVLLDDGTTSSLFASTNGISDSWEAQIPAPQYAGYVIQENEYFKAADYFYHKVDLTRSSGSGEGTGGSEEGTVWQRMNGTTKTLTALYVPDATAFTIPTDPIVLNTEGGTVPAGWLNTTPLLTGRFYTEKPDADGTLPWIGDTYRFQAVYSLWRTDEKGRPVLDGNKNQIQDKVTVSYGRSARDILEVRDGDGNALSGFGFLDTLEEGRTYEIHVDAAFVDESGNPVLSMLQDGVPAPLAANAARQGLTLPPCTFTVQAVSLPGE